MFLTLGPLRARVGDPQQGLDRTALNGLVAFDRRQTPALRADRPDEPGTTPDAISVSQYYLRTRGVAWVYAVLSAKLPLAVAIAALALAQRLADGGPFWNGLDDWRAQLADSHCAPTSAHALADMAGRLHFTTSFVALMAVSLVGIAFGLVSAARVLSVHVDGRFGLGWGLLIGWSVAGAALCVAGAGVFSASAMRLTAPLLAALETTASCAGKGDMASVGTMLFAGVFGAILALLAIGFGVFVIAWRFEIGYINGNWSDSYVLREKLNALMSLLFTAAILLVVANLFFTALADWSGADVARLAAPPDEAFSGALKAYTSAIGGFFAAVSSLVLIAMFLPCFLVLLDDINVAGRTHASYDMREGGDPVYSLDVTLPPLPSATPGAASARLSSAAADPGIETPLRVAGWKRVADWKAKHGLALSFSDLTANFIAIASPLLATGVVDVAKLTLGGR